MLAGWLGRRRSMSRARGWQPRASEEGRLSQGGAACDHGSREAHPSHQVPQSQSGRDARLQSRYASSSLSLAYHITIDLVTVMWPDRRNHLLHFLRKGIAPLSWSAFHFGRLRDCKPLASLTIPICYQRRGRLGEYDNLTSQCEEAKMQEAFARLGCLASVARMQIEDMIDTRRPRLMDLEL